MGGGQHLKGDCVRTTFPSTRGRNKQKKKGEYFMFFHLEDMRDMLDKLLGISSLYRSVDDFTLPEHATGPHAQPISYCITWMKMPVFWFEYAYIFKSKSTAWHRQKYIAEATHYFCIYIYYWSLSIDLQVTDLHFFKRKLENPGCLAIYRSSKYTPTSSVFEMACSVQNATCINSVCPWTFTFTKLDHLMRSVHASYRAQWNSLNDR